MKTKIKIESICIALLIFSIAAAGTASAASVVSVVPSNQNVAPGATFSVNVNIDSGSENLQAAHVELNYDPGVLTNVVVTKGSLLGSSILDEPATPIVTTNKVTYGATRASGNTAVPVNGTFFTVQFQVSSASLGASPLSLVNVQLKQDPSNNIANPQVNDGMVTMNGGSSASSQTFASQTSTPSTATTQKPVSTTTSVKVTTTPVEAGTTAIAAATAVETASAPKTPGFSAPMALIAVLTALIILVRRK